MVPPDSSQLKTLFRRTCSDCMMQLCLGHFVCLSSSGLLADKLRRSAAGFEQQAGPVWWNLCTQDSTHRCWFPNNSWRKVMPGEDVAVTMNLPDQRWGLVSPAVGNFWKFNEI